MKEAGHIVYAAPPNRQEIANLIRDFQPDIIAYSVISGWHRRYLLLNQWMKSRMAPNALSVFGGPHPTYFPTFVYEDGVDAICIGEGEQAFVEFVAKYEKQEDYYNTRNWWVKINGNLYKNPLRPEIVELDELPFPDRHLLLPYRSYINRNLRAFIASRGCPYSCSYCFNHAYRELYKENGLQTHLRRRSVDNVIAEIRLVREAHGMRTIAFYDDIFVTAPEWLEEFASKYSRSIGLPFECNLRIEQVTPKTISTLKQAGCVIIAIGIETADEEMRASILRRRYSNDQIAHACTLIRENDILLKTYNILGFPPGDIFSDLQTLRLNAALRVDLPTASLFQPYPCTELGEISKCEGYWDGSVDSIGPGFYRSSILALKDKTRIEVLQKLFFLGARFPKTMPLVMLCLAFAKHLWFRSFIFFSYRIGERIRYSVGEKIVAYKTLRHMALRMRKSLDFTGG